MVRRRRPVAFARTGELVEVRLDDEERDLVANLANQHHIETAEESPFRPSRHLDGRPPRRSRATESAQQLISTMSPT